MNDQKVLVVDDDPAIRRLIWKSLQSTGLLIYQSDSVESTIDILSRVKFDLFLLDISLEYENDGYHLAQLIREQDPSVPILILSGKTMEADIITGLEMGADMYLTKPFKPAIIRAQVLSSLRRSKAIHQASQQSMLNEITLGIFRLDLNQYQFFKEDVLVGLSSKETQLMQFFMENPNQVFTKDQIYSNVWEDSNTDANTIMVFINHLRNKIEDNPKEVKYLKNVWGIGYAFYPEGN